MRTLRADEIECRVSTVKENGCSLLLYKDARCDMRILDETYGLFNWQRSHSVVNGNLFCSVGIRENAMGEWVWKQDVGVESNAEKEKGQASDAFKRACFNWGIGRELYTAPFIWVNLAEKENVKTLKFKVKEIEYVDGVITHLVIVDSKGKVRYPAVKERQEMKPQEQTATKTIGQAKAEILSKLFTDLADKKIIKPTDRNATMQKLGVKQLADLTEEQYGTVLNWLKKHESNS